MGIMSSGCFAGYGFLAEIGFFDGCELRCGKVRFVVVILCVLTIAVPRFCFGCPSRQGRDVVAAIISSYFSGGGNWTGPSLFLADKHHPTTTSSIDAIGRITIPYPGDALSSTTHPFPFGISLPLPVATSLFLRIGQCALFLLLLGECWLIISSASITIANSIRCCRVGDGSCSLFGTFFGTSFGSLGGGCGGECLGSFGLGEFSEEGWIDEGCVVLVGVVGCHFVEMPSA
mmetsp:Transcript_2757/g.4840  ORF Transcript_2757/g.4840 Transcript_2757/m.4840 type:complete len:231 (-) Transcript_2757:89-781(-)